MILTGFKCRRNRFWSPRIYETSINSNDSNSSWYKNQDLNVMLEKTQTKIDTLN